MNAHNADPKVSGTAPDRAYGYAPAAAERGHATPPPMARALSRSVPPHAWFLMLALSMLLSATLGVLAQTAPAPDERAIWQLWLTHTNNLSRHESVITACREFETRQPNDPFVVIARGLSAWHLLKQHRTAEAREVLERLTATRDSSPLGTAGTRMGRAWLTRLEREAVKESLRRFYAREVAFPDSLDVFAALPAGERPPMRDAWNNPWHYQLEGFRFLAGLDNQRYVLESRSLGHRSDLSEALAAPYAQALRYTPRRLIGSAGRVAVAFEQPPDTPDGAGEVIAMVGARLDRATFAFMGNHLIVLATTDHWNLLRKP